ncbi:MAG TPA: sensor histidine kinase [Gemmatimonadaceae bacterium]|jgi:signal transduction histidine kinase
MATSALEFGAAAVVAPSEKNRSWLRKLASTPLLAKLVVTDVMINVAAVWIVNNVPPRDNVEIILTSLIVTLALNAAIVYWALLPLRALEATTLRVARGDFDARFAPSPLADRNLARIGRTFNDLLDRLTADRARARQLAAQVISAGDSERARIARELHDSTAQSLSALEMMLSAALQERQPSPTSTERLSTMHDIAKQALGEVRTLSHNVHPRVLDDLGLVAGIEHLARRMRLQSSVKIWVVSDDHSVVPPVTGSVLFRVAQEAIGNAIKHASARELRVSITTSEHDVVLEVRDDGRGFNVGAAEASMRGMGLFSMRERLGLVGGVLEILSAPDLGTTVRATVPKEVSL